MATKDRTSDSTKIPEHLPDFKYKEHVDYFKRNLVLFPSPYTSNDALRIYLAYFCISGLDLLGAVDDNITPQEKADWIDWLYAQQILPPKESNATENIEFCGFRGSPWSGTPFQPNATHSERLLYDRANLAMTYTALLTLIILGDDLSRVNRDAILNALKLLQRADGSFASSYENRESDMRFLYCACAISYILNDWRAVDTAKALDFIKRCHTYEYGFGFQPREEAHGGSAYLVIGTLVLLNKLSEGLLNQERTIEWLIWRQQPGSGFHGRSNKPADTCYSFWVGGSLEMLNAYTFVDYEFSRSFLMSTQTKFGGFGKYENTLPDVLHSYLGIAGLSLLDEPGIRKMDVSLNVSRNGVEHMKKATVFWRNNL